VVRLTLELFDRTQQAIQTQQAEQADEAMAETVRQDVIEAFTQE